MRLTGICGEGVSGQIRCGGYWTVLAFQHAQVGRMVSGEWFNGFSVGVLGAITEQIDDFPDNEIAYVGKEEADIVDTIDNFVDNLIGTIPPSFGTFTEQIGDFFDAVAAMPGVGTAPPPPPILLSSSLGGSGGGRGLDWSGKPDSGKPRIKIVERIVRHEIKVPTVDPATKQRIAALEHEVAMLRGRMQLMLHDQEREREEFRALLEAVAGGE